MKIKKKYMLTRLIVCLVIVFMTSNVFAVKPIKVLVFSKTAGFHHKSIPVGIVALQKMGQENKFEVDTTTNASLFTYQNLKQYEVIIFLSTTGNILDNNQQNEFQRYINHGGGFVGIHGASDCEYDWPWYGNLVGAYFSAHPKQQMAVLKVVDANNISTKHLPAEWKRFDEWYNFKWMATDLNILINIDETSYDAGPKKMGENHPMSWYHEYDGGRSFYTELGHTDESYQDPLFLKHVLGGIKYAMGVKK